MTGIPISQVTQELEALKQGGALPAQSAPSQAGGVPLSQAADEVRQVQVAREQRKAELAPYYNAIKDVNVNNLGEIREALKPIPEEDWPKVYEAMSLYEHERPSLAGRMFRSFVAGLADIKQAYAKTLEVAGTKEEIAAAERINQIATQKELYDSDDPAWERALVQASRMAPAAALMAGGGVAAGSLARGLGAAAGGTAEMAAVTGGVTAASFPMEYRQAVSGMREAGLEPEKTKPIAALTGVVSGLVESIIPNPFKADPVLGQGLRKAITSHLIGVAKRYPGELSEEFIQDLVHEAGVAAATWADDTVPNANLTAETVVDAVQNTKEAALPLAILMGAPAAVNIPRVAAAEQTVQEASKKYDTVSYKAEEEPGGALVPRPLQLPGPEAEAGPGQVPVEGPPAPGGVSMDAEIADLEAQIDAEVQRLGVEGFLEQARAARGDLTDVQYAEGLRAFLMELRRRGDAEQEQGPTRPDEGVPERPIPAGEGEAGKEVPAEERVPGVPGGRPEGESVAGGAEKLRPERPDEEELNRMSPEEVTKIWLATYPHLREEHAPGKPNMIRQILEKWGEGAPAEKPEQAPERPLTREEWLQEHRRLTKEISDAYDERAMVSTLKRHELPGRTLEEKTQAFNQRLAEVKRRIQQAEEAEREFRKRHGGVAPSAKEAPPEKPPAEEAPPEKPSEEEGEPPLPTTKKGLVDEIMAGKTSISANAERNRLMRRKKADLEDLVRRLRSGQQEQAEKSDRIRKRIPEIQKVADEAGRKWRSAIKDYLKNRRIDQKHIDSLPSLTKGETIYAAAARLAELEPGKTDEEIAAEAGLRQEVKDETERRRRESLAAHLRQKASNVAPLNSLLKGDIAQVMKDIELGRVGAAEISDLAREALGDELIPQGKMDELNQKIDAWQKSELDLERGAHEFIRQALDSDAPPANAEEAWKRYSESAGEQKYPEDRFKDDWATFVRSQPKKKAGPQPSGVKVKTEGGREIPAPPRIEKGRDVKKLDQWLLDQAIQEAEARGDDYNLTIFRGEKLGKEGLPQASRDSINLYLFGETHPEFDAKTGERIKEEEPKPEKKIGPQKEPFDPAQYPFGKVSSKEEQKHRGARVSVAPETKREEPYHATVERVLNGGTLIEVRREGDESGATFRIPGARVTVLEQKPRPDVADFYRALREKIGEGANDNKYRSTFKEDRVVKVTEQPDEIANDIIGKKFFAPFRDPLRNSLLVWMGDELVEIDGIYVTAKDDFSPEEADTTTRAQMQEIEEGQEVKHIVTWKEYGEDRGASYRALGKAKEFAKELKGKPGVRDVNVESRKLQYTERPVKASDIPTAVRYDPETDKIETDLTDDQVTVVSRHLQERYGYAGTQHPSQELKEVVRDRKIQRKVPEGLQELVSEERELERQRDEARKTKVNKEHRASAILEEKTKEIAKAYGVPPGRRRGSLSSAKQYKDSILNARAEAREDPEYRQLVKEGEEAAARQKTLEGEIQKVRKKQRRYFKEKLDKEGLTPKAGDIRVSRTLGPRSAIRIEAWNEAEQTFEVSEGAFAETTGIFYPQYPTTRHLGPSEMRSYVTIEESLASQALTKQVDEAIEAAEKERKRRADEKREEKTAEELRKRFSKDLPKKNVTAKTIWPLSSGRFVTPAVANGKDVLSDGRFAVYEESAPKSLKAQRDAQVEKGNTHETRDEEGNVRKLDITRYFEAENPKPLQALGYLAPETEDGIGTVILTDGENAVAIDSNVYRYFTENGFAFVGNLEKGGMVVQLSRAGKVVGAVTAVTGVTEEAVFPVQPLLRRFGIGMPGSREVLEQKLAEKNLFFEPGDPSGRWLEGRTNKKKSQRTAFQVHEKTGIPIDQLRDYAEQMQREAFPGLITESEGPLEYAVEAVEIADKLLKWKAGDRLTEPENFVSSWAGWPNAKRQQVVDELTDRGELPLGFSRRKMETLSARDLLDGLTRESKADKYKKPRGGGGTTKASRMPEGGEPGAPEEFEPKPGPEAPMDDKMRRFQAQPMPGPEMIQFVKKLLGKVPQVKKLRRYLGFFQHGMSGSPYGRMVINAFAAQDPQLLAKVLAHEIGHMVDWLPDFEMSRGNILGRVASLHRYMKHWLAGYPGGKQPLTDKERERLRREAKKLLSKGAQIEVEEEIVERYDITADDILAIWNQLDQSKLNPDLLRYIKRLSTAEKMSIVKEAMRGVVPDELKRFAKEVRRKTGQTITKEVEQEPTPEEISEKYQELLRDEIEKRMLLSAELMREELIRLTEWWSPFDRSTASDSYIQYRESSPELYAEALSVFLNSPGDLANRAPEFFRGFMAYMDEKPEVLQEYMAIQDLLNEDSDKLSEARAAMKDAAYLEADQKILAWQSMLEELKRKPIQRVIQILKQFGISRGDPIYRRAKETMRKDPFDEKAQSAYYAINELSYSENRNTKMLERVKTEVQDPLLEAGVTLYQVGRYLEFMRVVGERYDMANPGGYTPPEAAKEVDYIRRTLGDETFELLKEKMQLWHDIMFESAEAAVESGVWSRQAFNEYILPNKDHYATFAIIKHITGTISPMLSKQVGTFEDAANPYDSTIRKMVSLNRLIELNNAKNDVRDFLLESWSDEIKPTPIPYGRNTPKEPPPPGHEYLYVYENGRQKAYAVPWEIADSFKSHDIGSLVRIGNILQSAVYKVWHPLFVSYAPSFLTGNPFRDLRRSYINLGALGGKYVTQVRDALMERGMSEAEATAQARKMGISLWQVLYAFGKALPASAKHASGIRDAAIDELFDAKALSTPYVEIEAEIGEPSEAVRLMEKHGIKTGFTKEEEMTPLRRAWANTLGWLPWIGNIQETGTKLAAWNILKERAAFAEELGVDILGERERAYHVRTHSGTPNFKEKGLATPLTNGVFMYSNVMFQGLSADLSLARDSRTAAGWWWRQVLTNLIPTTVVRLALYGAFGRGVAAMLSAAAGDDEEDGLLRRIGGYYLDSYDVIPIGTLHDPSGASDTAKTVFLSIPKDDLGRTMSTIWGSVLDLMAATAGGDVARMTPTQAKEKIVTALGTQFTPDWAPPLDIAFKWWEFWSGTNPIDSYRGSEIIPRTEWESGSEWHRTKKMLAWTEGKFGSVGQVTHLLTGPTLGAPYEPGGESTIEMAIRAPLGWNRLIRVSNAGIAEREWAEIEAEERESARFRLGLPKSSRYLAKQYWRVSRLDEDMISQTRKAEGVILRQWYYDSYLPTTKMIKAYQGTADEETYRRQLEQESEWAVEAMAEVQGVEDPWASPDQLSGEVRDVLLSHAVDEVKRAALESGRPERQVQGRPPTKRESESWYDYRTRWQTWQKRETETPAEYQTRLAEWRKRRDRAERFLKKHRRSPLVQQALQKVRYSKAGIEAVNPKPPEAPKGGSIGDDWSEWGKRIREMNRRAARARKIFAQ